jgi:hypothetical protein
MRLAIVAAICLALTSLAVANAASSSDEGPAEYIVRVVAVDEPYRNKFVNCLSTKERPFWQKLRAQNKIVSASVFELDKVLDSKPDVPPWNFVILSHLEKGVLPNDVLELFDAHFAAQGQCVFLANGSLKRLEIMRTTPNCNYARENLASEESAVKAKAEYIVEYIDAKDLERYSKNMRENIGPAEPLLMRDGWDLSFLALETLTVRYSAPGMTAWNQIHIGLYAEKGSSEQERAARDVALLSVNPKSGGYQGVFGPLDTYRTKPREDQVKQRYELAVH